MRRLIVSLSALASLREHAAIPHSDLTAANALAELAGASAVRLGIRDDLKPVNETDVRDLRRCARRFELRMPASQGLLKVALEARPDRVVLAGEGLAGDCGASSIDPRLSAAALGPIIRSLEEAGIGAVALIAPEVDAVKAAHGLGVSGVEFYTGALVDLPEAERRAELERLSDAVRIASKLRLSEIGVGGGLDFRSTPEVLEAAPAAGSVAAGRALVARSLLVGIDRAVRDYTKLLG